MFFKKDSQQRCDIRKLETLKKKKKSNMNDEEPVF